MADRLRRQGKQVSHASVARICAIDVTMNIYAHASLDEKRTALSRLGERLG
ncbi:MAG: hypothetical protein ACR2KL_05820 [Nocardioidaceae bacterium]